MHGSRLFRLSKMPHTKLKERFMTAIVFEGHIHRLMSDLTVESAKIITGVQRSANETTMIYSDWKIVSPEKELQMTSGEFDAFIRKHLILLSQILPEGRPKMPVSETVENVAKEVEPV